MAVVLGATQLPMIGSIGLTTVIACRVTLGAAEGPAYPVALHSLYKWFPDRLRVLPTALVAQGAGIGLALTLPALNGLVVRYFGTGASAHSASPGSSGRSPGCS